MKKFKFFYNLGARTLHKTGYLIVMVEYFFLDLLKNLIILRTFNRTLFGVWMSIHIFMGVVGWCDGPG